MIIDPSIIFPIGALIGIIFGLIFNLKKEKYLILISGVLILLIMHFTDKITRYLPYSFGDILTHIITFIGSFMLGLILIFVLRIITSGSDYRY